MNESRFFSRITFAVCFSLTMAFTLSSCSGDDGIDGSNGENGDSCEIREGSSAEAKYDVYCGDVKVGTLSDGAKGDKGEMGATGGKGETGEVGQSCNVSEDGNYFVMKCGGVEKSRWVKTATCGGEVYSLESKFCDSRDNKAYKFVKIGEQTWMAENLNYAVGTDSWCYNDQSGSCLVYGRLYNWASAMSLLSMCNTTASTDADCTINDTHRGVCPEGWHIPSDAEWTTLISYAGDISTAGKKLKAAHTWTHSLAYVGTDDYGFSAFPSGSKLSGSFSDAGDAGYWWSATENDASDTYFRAMNSANISVLRNIINKSNGFSVRCVKD